MTALPLAGVPVTEPVMLNPESLPIPSPTRSRAGLIPLRDESLNDPWFLGATGRIAHRPAVEGSLSELLYRREGRSLPPERSACGVFLTQILAGPDVARCGLCELTAAPRHQGEPMT
jgi:hypothetical protein